MSKDADEITALHTLYVRKIVDRCLLNDKVSLLSLPITTMTDLTFFV